MKSDSRIRFLVNTRSGGGAGQLLMKRLKSSNDHIDVMDLLEIDLGRVLEEAEQNAETIVVCGGDGSIASVLDSIYKNNLNLAPALVPLGTGNDLARVLGWMPLRSAPVPKMLAAIKQAKAQQLDRMFLKGPDTARSWYNYCSWGMDARIAREFDLMRKRYPVLFRSHALNQCIYALISFRQYLRPLRYKMTGVSHLNGSMASALCTNIASYAGGLCLSSKINAADRRFDFIALPHVLRYAAVVLGCRRAKVLAQQSRLAFELLEPVAMQCDGEAWLAQAGAYEISCVGQVQVLARNPQNG